MPFFAIDLRTIVRTLENWEQGRAKPNAKAALLINQVKLIRYSRKARHNLVAYYSADQSVLVIDTNNDLE